MDEQRIILTRFAQMDGDIYELERQSKKCNWDFADILYVLKNADILNAISHLQNHAISAAQLEDWANFLECREGLGFENEITKELIFELANPLLYGELSSGNLETIKGRLPN